MKIRVTKSHIRRGRQCHTSACPVALAIKEQLGAICIVDGFGAVQVKGRTWYTAKSVEKFIDAFDHGKKVKPFNFIIKGL